MIKKILSLLITIILFFVAFPVHAQNDNLVFVVSDIDDARDLREVLTVSSKEIGGNIAQVMPPRVALLEIPEGTIDRLRSMPHIVRVFDGPISSEEMNILDASVVQSAHIWNGLAEAQKEYVPVAPINDSLPSTSLVNPTHDNYEINSAIGETTPYGAGHYDTSEFMHGSISVAVILTESNGTFQASSEDWTIDEEVQVQSEITNGLNWWVSQYSAQNATVPISFTTHFYNGRTDARAQTQYEPITNLGATEPQFWGDEIMEKFGYATTVGGSDRYFYRAADYINDMRTVDGTNWGLVVFVADDTNDFDNAFADGMFGYAWLGGPSIQLTYDNDGWGISNMDSVMAHELGHTFYALDEYASAPSSCSEQSGYSYIQNQNYDGGCLLDEDGIMRGTLNAFSNNLIDMYTRGQIGWLDSNGNHIADILDVDPLLSIDTPTLNRNNVISLSGSAEIQKTANQNAYLPSQTIHGSLGYPKNNINPDTISKIEYLFDCGASTLLYSGGTNAATSFSFQTQSLSDGSHVLQVIATSALTGKTTSKSTSFVLGSPDPPVGSAITLGDDELSVSWENPSSFHHMSVVRKIGSAPINSTDGSEVYNGKGTSYVDVDVTNGVHYYYVVFACNAFNQCSPSSSVSGKANARLIVTGSGNGQAPYVRTFGYLGDKKSEFLAFARNVTSGVEVATGDLDGDGIDEIIVGAGMGGGPQVRVFDRSGQVKFTNGFFAYASTFRGGVHVGAADVDGDGIDEIITGAGMGGGPHVRIFDGFGNSKYVKGLFPYPQNFKGGVFVAGGDLNGDGIDEIITGPGNGGGPQVRVFDKNGRPTLTNGFFAYGKGFRGGVLVSASDLNADGKDEIIAGSGFTGGPQVRTFTASGIPIFTPGFFAYDKNFRGGVYVSGHDVNGDGKSEIITGTGFSGGPHVRIFTRYGVPYLTSGFFSEDKNARAGTYISAGNF